MKKQNKEKLKFFQQNPELFSLACGDILLVAFYIMSQNQLVSQTLMAVLIAQLFGVFLVNYLSKKNLFFLIFTLLVLALTVYLSIDVVKLII